MNHDPEVVIRVGVAWRELRRGAASQALRQRVYGQGPEALDIGQVDALDLLAERDGCRMSDLAESLRVDASTATRAVDRLVADGFVVREPSAEDRRAVVVRLTDRGRERQTALADQRRSLLERVATDFDGDELVALAELLERLVAAVDRVVAEPPGG